MGEMIIFPLDPVPAPRMTSSDRWKTDPNAKDARRRQRPAVMRYFAFRDNLQWMAKARGYDLKETLDILFVIPMPDSWSKKKKQDKYLAFHQQRPDIDNLLKAFLDSLASEDGFVCHVHAKKIWGNKGGIVINPCWITLPKLFL